MKIKHLLISICLAVLIAIPGLSSAFPGSPFGDIPGGGGGAPVGAGYLVNAADPTLTGEVVVSAYGLSLALAANAAAARTLLDLEAGTDFYSIAAADLAFSPIAHNHAGVYQPLHGYLTDIAALSPSTGDIMYFNGTDWVVLAAGTANYLLKANGAAAPSWTNTLSGLTLSGFTASRVLQSDGSGNAEASSVTTTELGYLSGLADVLSSANSKTLTNKTLDANGTGNVLKGYGYIYLLKPTSFGSGVTQQTTATDEYYGQALFANATDEATNYVEYRLVVPPDIDTTVDLTATFKFRLGGADTADHDYQISMSSVADSAAYAGSVGNQVALAFDADASGADGDVETATATLTDWKSNVTAGNHWVIRVARDGDDGTNDASTADSYSGTLVIRYGFTQ